MAANTTIPTPNPSNLPYSMDPNGVRRSSMRSVQTLQAMPILHEDENSSMPKLPLPTFDNLSRSSLSRPSSLRHSFSRNSGSITPLPAVEWSDEEAHKKYLETVSSFHRQRPTTVYSYVLAAPKPLSDSSGDIAMSDLKLEQNAQAAAEEGRAVPDGKKKRDYFFTHFSWWRAMMMVLLLIAIGAGLGLGLHYGLKANP
ncbi:hypothetical protein F503_02174 [Ophiostoma piceae UAMH 11346]|uniref:Uncharacterized protein n=1 Tax=Ophiostoma piceae (strain UAMH 11346) TaxID=1262450 RepID=S3CX66_OPHP1|nr:hypothetical protein F503_02174 [Ophiostoma piceae UAMH 11346]